MPRTRSIKPSFFTDDELAELPPLTRLLFAGLPTIADREGRLEDRPKRIKAELMPFDDCDVDEMLSRLAKPKPGRAGFIIRYQVGERAYIAITTFNKHQHPHVNEPESVIPPPSNGGSASTEAAPTKNGASTGAAPEDSGRNDHDHFNDHDHDHSARGATSPAAAVSPDFFAQAADLRRAKKLPLDEPGAKTRKRLEAALPKGLSLAVYEQFLATDDDYLRSRKPPWPLDHFAKHWERYLPSTTGPPKRDVRKGTTRAEDFYPPSKGKKQEDGSTF